MNIEGLGDILMQAGTQLMSSGANTQRVRNTVKRIAEAFGCDAEVLVTHQSLHLYLKHRPTQKVYHNLHKSLHYKNDLAILGAISEMSWKVAENHWSLEKIQDELLQLQSNRQYSEHLIWLAVALAGSAFAQLVGANGTEMAAVFVATLMGMIVRQRSAERHFNPYLVIFLAAIVASVIPLGLNHWVVALEQTHTLPASVLFLVPGIPLINAFSDFVDGNILNGLLRTFHSLLIAFAITLGYLTALLAFP